MECYTVSLRVAGTPGSVTALSPTLGFPSFFSLFDPCLYLDASLRNPVFYRCK